MNCTSRHEPHIWNSEPLVYYTLVGYILIWFENLEHEGVNIWNLEQTRLKHGILMMKMSRVSRHEPNLLVLVWLRPLGMIRESIYLARDIMVTTNTKTKSW